MALPIIWTVLAVLVIGYAFYLRLFNVFGALIVVISLACAALQWMVYRKKK